MISTLTISRASATLEFRGLVRSGRPSHRNRLEVLQNEESSSEKDTRPDWNALLCSVADQDRAAFAALFAHFAPRVKSYMLRLGSDSTQAEELAQEALATVWRKADRYDPSRAAASRTASKSLNSTRDAISSADHRGMRKRSAPSRARCM